LCGSPVQTGLLVELNALVIRAAKDHRAHAGVTDRESFDPKLGGLAIPESLRVQQRRLSDLKKRYNEKRPGRNAGPNP
jgi:hypothetical protein